jgi:regulatory protein
MKSFLQKAGMYCAYQERTQQEVREKLLSWGADVEEAEEVIAYLITQNYLNEARFARQYAGGKFRVKNWGRRKIRYALKSKGLSERCIEEALAEIGEEEYREAIEELVKRELNKATKVSNPLLKKKKVVDFLVQKGYEADLVREMVG